MVALKNRNLIPLLTLSVLAVIGCAPKAEPNPVTPTPLPVVVQEDRARPTLPVADGSPNSEDSANRDMDELSAGEEDSPAEMRAVIDSLSLRIDQLFPVRARVTIGGYLSDNCGQISGWEQSLNDNVLFVRPTVRQLEGVTCSSSQVPFEEVVDLDVKGLSAGELSNGGYFLDANGFTLPLSPAFASSLLNEELSGCPTAGDGQVLYLNEDSGFCLLFPATFEFRDDESPGVAGFYGPPLDDSVEPVQALLYVYFGDRGNGRTLEEIAQERISGRGQILSTTSATLGGEPAILAEVQGERSNFLEIVTTHEGQVLAVTVAPYDQNFPQSASDVELAWNLALDSFAFMQPNLTGEQATPPAEFESLLASAITMRDFGRMQALMNDTFGFAFWRSQGYPATPEEAVEQLRLNYLFADQTINFEVEPPDLSQTLGPESILSIWDPGQNPVAAVFSTGWGPTGQEEAFLIIGQKPDGAYAWEGIILAHGSHGGFAGLDGSPAQTGPADVGQLMAILIRSPDRPALWPPNIGDIGTVFSDGSQRRQLTIDGYNSDPILSPDETLIAYRSVPRSIISRGDPLALHEALNRDIFNIWIITADGSQSWQLTDSEESRSVPTWSPDSRRLAFSQGQEGLLAEIEIETLSCRILARGAHAPRYKPDAAAIAFITESGGLAWLNESGGRHMIVDGQSLPDNSYVADFDWLGTTAYLIYTLADDSERQGQSTVGIRHQLYAAALSDATSHPLAEDVHSIRSSADGRIVAGLSGSGYADCLSDLQPVFLMLSPDMSSAERIIAEIFEGYPEGGKDYLYPISDYVWIDGQSVMLEAHLTCTSDQSANGWYMVDPVGGTMRMVMDGGA